MRGSRALLPSPRRAAPTHDDEDPPVPAYSPPTDEKVSSGHHGLTAALLENALIDDFEDDSEDSLDLHFHSDSSRAPSIIDRPVLTRQLTVGTDEGYLVHSPEGADYANGQRSGHSRSARAALSEYVQDLQATINLADLAAALVDRRRLLETRIMFALLISQTFFLMVCLAEQVVLLIYRYDRPPLSWNTTNSTDTTLTEAADFTVTATLLLVTCFTGAVSVWQCRRRVLRDKEVNYENKVTTLRAQASFVRHQAIQLLRTNRDEMRAVGPKLMLSLLRCDEENHFNRMANENILADLAYGGLCCKCCSRVEVEFFRFLRGSHGTSFRKEWSVDSPRSPSSSRRWTPSYQFALRGSDGRWKRAMNTTNGTACLAKKFGVKPDNALAALKEVALLSQLRHANVLPVEAFYWSQNDGYVLVSSFVGISLQNVFDRDPLLEEMEGACRSLFAQVRCS